MCYVIPAFNAQATVGRTLWSVLSQRGPRVHAIVVDDGSSDGTSEAARVSRDWRVEVVRQRNLGLAGARNTGLEVLEDRAEFVCFLDADDTVEPGHARALCSRLEATEGRGGGMDVAACGYRMVGPELEDLGWTIDVSASEMQWRRLIEYNPMAVGGVVARVEAVRECGGARPFDETLAVHEDWDLWLRMVAGGWKWAEPVQGALFNYRLRAGSLSKRVGTMWRVGQRVIERASAAREVSEGERVRVQRHWTLRHLARAAVAEPGLAGEMLVDLDSRGGRGMDEGDVAAFVGSLRHAFMLEHAEGPARAGEFEREWKQLAMEALGDWSEARGAVESLAFGCWERVAERLEHLVARGGGREGAWRPVVAGMGRNGRALARALAARSIGFDWYDEAPDAAVCPVAGAARVGLGQVSGRHVVVVTPALATEMTRRLRATGAVVMMPGEVVAGVQGREGEELSTGGVGRRVA